MMLEVKGLHRMNKDKLTNRGVLLIKKLVIVLTPAAIPSNYSSHCCYYLYLFRCT